MCEQTSIVETGPVRATTRALYEQRMGWVTDHIYQHLDDQIDLNRLADIACMSPYHWHRVYQAMQGETIAATVKRLRLQRAAHLLANSVEPIEKVARRAGYSSVQSFSRAFKSAYQMPPAQYREQGPHNRFKRDQLAGGATNFDVRVEVMPSIDCVAVPHTGPYLRIDEAFNRLFTALNGAGALTPQTQMIGVFMDDPALKDPSQLESFACVSGHQKIDMSEPLEAYELLAGLHGVLRHKGPYSDMKAAYNWLYGRWLPDAGYEVADRPSYEIYLNDPKNTPPTELLVDIYLPLQA